MKVKDSGSGLRVVPGCGSVLPAGEARSDSKGSAELHLASFNPGRKAGGKMAGSDSSGSGGSKARDWAGDPPSTVGELFVYLESRLGGLDGRFEGLDARLQGFDARLTEMQSDARVRHVELKSLFGNQGELVASLRLLLEELRLERSSHVEFLSSLTPIGNQLSDSYKQSAGLVSELRNFASLMADDRLHSETLVPRLNNLAEKLLGALESDRKVLFSFEALSRKIDGLEQDARDHHGVVAGFLTRLKPSLGE